MPSYEYECKSCGNDFDVVMTITEHERKDQAKEIRCPKCQSQDVKHVMENVFVTTSKKS